jgi:tetratricopeptide (TPR) repeat protein
MNKLACILAGFLLTAASLSAAQTGAEVLKLVLETRYEEARIAGLARIVAKPDDVDAYLGLALSLIELERYADADNYARKGYAVRKDPRLAEASGEASYHLGNNEAALRGLQEFIGAFPEVRRAGRAYYYTGEVYIRLGRFMHADMALTAAVQYIPENSLWWARLGWAREQAGRKNQALAAYNQALNLDPRLPDALLGRRRISENM